MCTRKTLPPLSRLPVLTLDCQATHSHPDKGHLIEIGWAKTPPAVPFELDKIQNGIETYLVREKKNVKIPGTFLKITGIKPEEIQKGSPLQSIWKRLSFRAQEIMDESQGLCLTVIHYKRYEEPHLRHLHERFDPKGKFPFTLLCTHEIFKRLYPGHPRKSLRAVAGYLGLSLPEFRRSLHHVAATTFIWQRLITSIEEREGISTLDHLLGWLAEPRHPDISPKTFREYPMQKKFRQDLPDRPGIYRMYRANGDLLYIGKTKSLKRRIQSYFHQGAQHAEHILEMLSQAQSLSATETRTSFEAAIRESDEIKKHRPLYNRALRPSDVKIVFYSEDLGSRRCEPDIDHPIGPVPPKNNMEALANFIDILNGKRTKFTSEIAQNILAIPPEYLPAKEIFKMGLATFQDEFLGPIKRPITLSSLMSLGARFWKDKLAEKEEAPEEEEEEEREEELARPEWTPERVRGVLKSVVMLGAFQIRRSSWFCRLSESVIVWDHSHNHHHTQNKLILTGGLPRFEYDISPNVTPHPPPGHSSSLLERQKCFGIITFDRMRIVTTEMRRIIHEGREIQLIVHPNVLLRNDQLQRMLKWL